MLPKYQSAIINFMEQIPMHESLEHDIKELSQKLEGASPETQREVLKNAIGKKIQQTPNASPVPQNTIPQTNKTSLLPDYSVNVPEEAKLRAEKLVDLAWHKGLSAGISEAKKSDPLTMDMFHDAITGKLYEEFKKQGMIQ
ncbi:MAG: hypothetical protein COU07_00490 [Candidatus Harrisonbacteria bacterium CG10_big_fil_rev_8_21_14_0_10_40_38]|uniref:Uncharacterized protein n=1 Tax=Candidatus Harrisonbacteria bacterium CG10_big_fil_rev_8_21_14_0_10_40_38 TaxID=1974583 RepID=A0A2H0USH2_9BACT|nr:MAG: hypothetical protein COU07_00490 [Candidatus Harrisonbacteria bacterium CG10_big_fil_rev_8_21_14_0_10_40_38]